MSGRYRRKPVEIEAVQWQHSGRGTIRQANIEEVEAFLGFYPLVRPDRLGQLGIETLEGTMWAAPGDWIIRGVQGEFYPCKSDIFEATYEKVADERDADPVSEVRGDEAP